MFKNTEVNGTKARKKLTAPDISLILDHSEESVLSDDLDESGEIDLDNLDTPSENSNEFEWEGKYFVTFVWGSEIFLFSYVQVNTISGGK